MRKMELVKNAISYIRFDISLARKYADEHNWEMYGHMICVISAKVAALLEIGLISINQYSRLFGIVNRMEAGKYVRH